MVSRLPHSTVPVLSDISCFQKRPALRDLSNRQPAGPQTRTAKAALANPLSNELRDKLTLATSRPFKIEEPVRREVGILDCDFEDEMQNAEYAPDIYRNLWKAEVLAICFARNLCRDSGPCSRLCLDPSLLSNSPPG